MELDEVTLEIPSPQSNSVSTTDINTSSEVILCYKERRAVHLELLINPVNNKPSLKIKFIQEPIHNFCITMKQVFADGRFKILDVEEISLERLIGIDEHLYIKKNGMKDFEQGSDFHFACDVKLTKADKTISSKYSNSTLQKMTQLTNDKKFADFTIKFKDGKELKVVKFLLSCKSRVFLKMFTTDMLESRRNEMHIPDVDYAVMKIAVNFMYSRSIVGLSYHIFDVLVVADKYEIPELKKYCEKRIAKGLTTQIVADVLIFADRYNANLLKEKTIQYIHRNWNEVKESKEFDVIYTYTELILDIFQTFDISNYPIKSIISNL